MFGLVVAEVEFMYKRDFYIVVCFKLVWVLAGFLIIQVKIRFWSAYIRELLKSLVAVENAYLLKASSRSWELSKDQLRLTLWHLGDSQASEPLDERALACPPIQPDSCSESEPPQDSEEDAADERGNRSPRARYTTIAEDSFLKTEADASLLV